MGATKKHRKQHKPARNAMENQRLNPIDLAFAGSLAIEILLGSPMRDIERATMHLEKVLEEMRP